MPTATSRCLECDAPLEADGACLPCVLGDALGADSSEPDTHISGSRFGSFAPQEAGMFGKYLLRRTLGGGGMGLIWEAEEMAARRVVALKMIRCFAFSSEAEKLRFTTEAQAAAQLDHPHIVPVYDVNEAEGQPFFTMKLLEGGTLSQRLKDGALPAREAALIMEKLARAVQHAHERGVLHRDLKPGNVLFDKTGEPFLTDFGLAKLADGELALTLTNAYMGTPAYMSPEQARGSSRDVTTASDVWGLGAMLYQMLTGRLPFPGNTPAEIFSRIAHDEPVSLRTLAATADGDLETLCLRCLEKESARRLTSAGMLADELARWLRGEPVHSRRVSGAGRALRWARRHPWRVGAGAALVFSLLAGTIVSLALWRRSEANRVTAVELAATERRTGYVSTLAAALAARERHDFARARQLLAAAPEEYRGFEWRLLDQFCKGDQRSLFRMPGGEMPDTLAPGPDGESFAIVTHGGVLHLLHADGSALRPSRQLPALAGKPDHGTANPHEYHGLAYAPGGKHFVCAFRNSVRVFDAETLEVVLEHTNYPNHLVQPQTAWLDERRLLYGHDRSTVGSSGVCAWIFDLQDRSTIELPKQWSAPLTVSADRSLVALTGGHRYEVSFLRAADLAGATPLQNATPIGRWSQHSFGRKGWAHELALSPDGRYFATLCGPFDDPSDYLEITETATGKVLLRQGYRDAMTNLMFHPTDPIVAVVGTDAAVRMFHFTRPIPEGQPTYDDDCHPIIREPLNGNGAHRPPHRLLTRSAQSGRFVFLLGHEGSGTGVAFTRDGKNLITCAADGTVRRWDPGSLVPNTRIADIRLLQLRWHPSSSPDGTRLLYASGSHETRYWQEGRGYTHLADDHHPLAVLPAGRLATMDRKTSDIILWQEEGEVIRVTDRIPGPGYIQGFSGLLRGVAFPDGTKLAGMTPGRIFVVDLEKRTVTATKDQGWETGASRAWDIAISPDGRCVAATGLGRSARLYDPTDLTKNAPSVGQFGNYDTALVFHPDGSRLYCGNEDGRVRVFDTATWSELRDESWQAHNGPVTALAISNDQRLIATAGDTTLKLWLLKKTSAAARVKMLSFPTYHPAAWLHFARDADGGDRALLNAQPYFPLEIWSGSRSPVTATPPKKISPLKVLRDR